MKTKISFIILTALLISIISSCSSTKKIEDINKSTEVRLPFEGNQYKNDKDYFRAVQSGKSPDLSTAKKIALLNAKEEMAANIQSTIKRVTKQYTNQRTVDNPSAFEKKFQEDAREIVKQELFDVNIMDSKVFRETNGTYTYWVVVETSRQGILNKINESIPRDKQLKLDYDEAQFNKIFNDEMKKFDKSHNSY